MKEAWSGNSEFVFWFCSRYSLTCYDQLATLQGRRTQQKGGSCNSRSRGNIGWQCRVDAERCPKEFKSNRYFFALCDFFCTFAIHSCNMFLWFIIQRYPEYRNWRRGSDSALLDLLIAVGQPPLSPCRCWCYLRFEVLEHISMVLQYLNIYCRWLYKHVWLSIEQLFIQLFLVVEYLALLLENLLPCWLPTVSGWKPISNCFYIPLYHIPHLHHC